MEGISQLRIMVWLTINDICCVYVKLVLLDIFHQFYFHETLL